MSEDLENNPFLNSALERFTCELYNRFGSFLAPLSVGIITGRHYYLSAIKMEEQVERKAQSTPQVEMSKNLSNLSKCEVIGSFIGMGMVGFYFGIGLILLLRL